MASWGPFKQLHTLHEIAQCQSGFDKNCSYDVEETKKYLGSSSGLWPKLSQMTFQASSSFKLCSANLCEETPSMPLVKDRVLLP